MVYPFASWRTTCLLPCFSSYESRCRKHACAGFLCGHKLWASLGKDQGMLLLDPRVPWTARRSNQSILREISPGCSLEGLMLKLKLQYFGHLIQRTNSFEKTLMLEKIEGRRRREGQEETGTTEDEMAGWHHWPNGRESEWTLGVGDGKGGLACCDLWGCEELDMTEQLNWTEGLLFCFSITFPYYVKNMS